MIVATYSVHNAEPHIHPRARGIGPSKWLIRVYATDGKEKWQQDIRHNQRCELHDLLPIAAQTADDTLTELDWVVTDAGFQVIRLR